MFTVHASGALESLHSPNHRTETCGPTAKAFGGGGGAGAVVGLMRARARRIQSRGGAPGSSSVPETSATALTLSNRACAFSTSSCNAAVIACRRCARSTVPPKVRAASPDRMVSWTGRGAAGAVRGRSADESVATSSVRKSSSPTGVPGWPAAVYGGRQQAAHGRRAAWWCCPRAPD